MRLEVFCEDRLGLTRELLDILASRNIDLRGIEIDVSGIIYLNCPDIDFDTFSELMAEIRRISGVKDVRKIQFMPMERHNTELLSLLNNVPDAVFAIDLKGFVDMANYSALSLFNKAEKEVIGHPISALLPAFNFSRWIEGNKVRQREDIVLDGLDYMMEMMPVYITGDSKESTLASTMMMIRSKSASTITDDHLPLHNNLGFEHFVGISNRHKALISQAKKLSMLEQPLLIEGETGTGKEMLAKACHNRSHRAAFPFLVLSCASMPDDVAETELFGHAPGSFNHQQGHKGIFEQANGGTVFLDEIGEMSPHLQIKLLRFLQDCTFRRVGEEHEVHVDVRVIASTRYKLADLAESGAFREDLFYRLNVLTLRIPALRERSNDVQPLLELFIAKHINKMGMKKPELAEDLVDQLALYQWPGNMRQLDNMVLRALTEMPDNVLSIDLFHLPQLETVTASSTNINIDGSLDDIMKEYEAQILERLYQSFPSSRKLAKRLNVSHTSIANKLRDYGIRKN
ncbi:transcriptional regulator TyrR [Vibrio aestuarianus]|uniref:transcriptional regulator TyrR n=1 Tax=Vibrio aestuarianus TaxID=28171 RepID=UPI001592B21A|nr:transcriptional regulator TyrR [Vibrio aestuarianus]MDE1235866.1 transcriptional regulator TyrR [Vibrio aestuarianus]MDE1246764.1 transcriptional regulator TyrR [Vibrio aestuarianus]NGZ63722.1 transcriptional regulator TyrR [Vibrio aestuarianus subsp. cardii]